MKERIWKNLKYRGKDGGNEYESLNDEETCVFPSLCLKMRRKEERPTCINNMVSLWTLKETISCSVSLCAIWTLYILYRLQYYVSYCVYVSLVYGIPYASGDGLQKDRLCLRFSGLYSAFYVSACIFSLMKSERKLKRQKICSCRGWTSYQQNIRAEHDRKKKEKNKQMKNQHR